MSSKVTPAMSLLELLAHARIAMETLLGSIKTRFFASAPSSPVAPAVQRSTTYDGHGNRVDAVIPLP